LDATLDEKQIRQWWGMWPNASIGIACGPSGLLVLDHDTRTTHLTGHADLVEYVRRTHGVLPETCVVATGSHNGSTHDYFRYQWASGDRIPSGLERGIDLKGIRGYTVAPPSFHISGNAYETDGLSGAKEFFNIAPAPDWLVTFVRNGGAKSQNHGPDTEEKWTEGSRNNKLFRLASTLRSQGMTVQEITAVLENINKLHCQPPLADSEIINITQSAGRYARGEQSRTEQAPLPRDEADWPDPEPLDALPGVEPLDEDLLPAAFRPSILDNAERMQLPPDFPAVVEVTAGAGTVGRRAAMQPKDRDTSWRVIANLWTTLIAMSGIGKSPLLSLCLWALTNIEQTWRSEHEAEIELYASALEVYKLEKRAWEREYLTAKKKGLSLPSCPKKPAEPLCKRLITNDALYEKLHVVMNQNPAGVMLVRDELTGLLSHWDREEYATERAFALSAWNGDTPHTVDRMERGTVHVPHCCLSVLGGITPDRLRNYLAQAPHNSPTADGLMQRFQLAIWPDISTEWEYTDRPPNAAAQQQATTVFQRLISLDVQAPKVYRFAPDAQELFIDWLTDLERTIRGNTLPAALQSHLGKYRSLMPSLALLFQLFDDAAAGVETDRVSLVHAQQAADWTVYLRSHAQRIYSVEVSPEFQAAILLADKIRNHKADVDGVLEVRNIYRHHWEGLSSPETVKAACDVLVDSGWLREIGEPSGGRPANRYRVNPKVRR
jgi:putative DNA primase/helicase